MDSFETNLKKLEQLTADIKRNDISLEDALKDFEEGMKLASGLEQELTKIEGKIQILMNEPNPLNPDNAPELDNYNRTDETTGSSGAPVSGTRQ